MKTDGCNFFFTFVCFYIFAPKSEKNCELNHFLQEKCFKNVYSFSKISFKYAVGDMEIGIR